MTIFQWGSVVCILGMALVGGYYPLFKRERARSERGLPGGESFTAGVFLALSLTIMFPTGLHLFNKIFPEVHYPLASVVAIFAFLLLLAVEHIAVRLQKKHATVERELSPPIIPVIMTVMIAIPSFLLGTALGISGTASAVFIFLAVMAHKASAGFGLALTMVRSTMTRRQTFILYTLFAISTPAGIVLGADMHEFLSGSAMVIVKASVLSLAAGVFLYMSTVHGFRHTPLVEHCSGTKGFSLMLLGLIITALVRFVLGYAHGG